MIKIISKGWQAEKYIGKCIDSILAQTFLDWELFFVLDPSEDRTESIINEYRTVHQDRIFVHVNTDRKFGSYNLYNGVLQSHANDEDIIVFIDADDWLAHPDVLKKINHYYLSDKNLLVTYGSWQGYPDPNMPNNNFPYTENEFAAGLRHMGLNSWHGSHLKTMKYKLFKHIREADFKNEGRSWLGSACDLSLMYAALEIAGIKRSKFIPEILYIYNRETISNCDKINPSNQEQCAEYVLTKVKPYQMIQHINYTFDVLIFTKDRACQLDLLLRSIDKYFAGYIYKINVLYKASNDSFNNAYHKCMQKFSNVNWILENNFTEDVKGIVNKFIGQYTLCFVDDEVIIRKPNLEIILPYMDNSINNISLRMHPQVTYSYTSECNVDIPNFIINDPIIKWEWTKLKPFGDWGYPSCLNSSIRLTSEFKELINKMQFRTPNTLEAAMDIYRNRRKPFMLAFKQPITISIPNNVTQEGISRNSNKPQFTKEALNQAYLNGYIINTNNLYEQDFPYPTIPVDYNFIEESK